MDTGLKLQPYRWEGPYAQWRATAPHDPLLCAELRATWMPAGERLILRGCEMIGDPRFFLYDDHTPPAEPETRGAHYTHIPFSWDTRRAPTELVADCAVPGRGKFTVTLTAREDSVDILLHIKNATCESMGPIDWSFCVIALESQTLRDPEHARTFIYDGRQLRNFAELRVGSGLTLVPVEGANGFAPDVHSHLARSKTRANKSVTILESRDGRHCAAIGFEQSYSCFGCTGNMCIHADPYFGVIEPGAEKTMRGRLYLAQGDRHAMLNRYLADFAKV